MPQRTYPTLPDGLPAPRRPISFVCVQFCQEYRYNIRTSEAVQDPMNQFIHVDNRQNLFFDTLGAAICHGVARAKHDLVVVVHEDVVLPKNWQARFEASLAELETQDPDWALLGAVGWGKDHKHRGHWSDPHTYNNTFEQENFAEVERLDEQLLILKRKGILQFDPNLPSIHNIGRDMARMARRHGRKSYAINAPTIHKYADGKGVLVQSREDSFKIKDRKSRTYLADRACSDAYLAHKWEAPPAPTSPSTLSSAQQAQLDAPIILVGRGGSGTRLLSTIAQDCGLFIGNKVNKSGDCMDMVHEIYATVFRSHLSRDPWLRSQSVPALRAAAQDMLDTAGWPADWGFKLPEVLLVLPEIIQAFPKAKFVEWTRSPQVATRRRTHMTARTDNHVGRTALRLAYDHFNLPRTNILGDGDQSRMVVTTLHQTALAERHLAGMPPERHLTLRFEDTLEDPQDVLARFSEFTGLPTCSHNIAETMDTIRANAPARKIPKAEQARSADLLRRLQVYHQRQKAVTQMRPVFVLGMHRSGTSNLTGSLEAAGLSLGETVQWAEGNRKGNREYPIAMEINTDVLAAHGGNWKTPPVARDLGEAPVETEEWPEGALPWPRAQRNARDIFLTGCPETHAWGLKDPRLLLTLEGWQAVLPQMRLVGTFRHPEAVAQSLLTRNKMPLEEGRALWLRYNQRLLALHQTAPFPLIDFDQPAEAYVAALTRVCQALDLPDPDAAAVFFDPALKTSVAATAEIADPEVAAVYAALQARAGM